LFYLNNRSYVTFDGLNITDPSLSPTDRTQQSKIERAFFVDGSSNNVVIKNCSLSLVGVGAYFVGPNNTIDHCDMGNMRMVRNTQGGDDDYGANPVVISSANNKITNNNFHDCWATSYDYGYDGGAVEFYGSGTNNNTVMYNTMKDCNGLMEFGSGDGGTSTGNIIAYNKLINNGSLIYINNSGNFAINVTNTQFYNNVIVETVAQRLNESFLMSLASSSSTSGIIILKNNIFWLTTGIDVARSSQLTGTQMTHQDNIFRLGSGSAMNFTAHSTELSTTASNIFMSIAPSDPAAWDYRPATSSPAIDFGQNVGIATDFAGNPVPAVPNSGIMEGNGGTTPNPLVATATAGTISCIGGTTTVTVGATGGTAPYTGTGTFTKAAGTYNYTVTDAAGGSATASVTITQPTAITVSVAAGTVSSPTGTTTATVTASGGTPAYTYNLDGGSYQAGNSFTGVPAGSHSITVKDSKGCTSVKAFTVTQTTGTPLSATATAGTISCNGGSTTVTVSATGGTAPYTGTGTFTKTAGTYNYTVTDAAGGSATASVTISQPAVITVSVAAGTVSSPTGTTTATVTASGGTPNYTYNLDGGSYQSSNIFPNVVAGNHSVTVKDGKACTSVKTFTVSVTGSSPLVISAVAGTISCYGGTTTVAMSATGGTAPYTGVGTFTVSAGTYTYTVTDANGTTGTTTVTVTQPTAITATVSAGTISTNGGSTTITASASGGTSPYTYKLNSGSYQSSNTFNNVVAGSYTITIKDKKGCTVAKTVTITQPGAGGALTISLVSSTNITCKGKRDGTIRVIGSGGRAPYQYRTPWVPYSSDNYFTHLMPGTYKVTVKDALGATAFINVTIQNSNVICGSGSKSSNPTESLNTSETDLKLQINAYPNPTTTEFSLVIENGNQDEEAQIVVMNLNGQKVYEGRSRVYEKNSFGRNFVSGIYIVKVTQGKNTQTLKLVKAK
jgi:hypothetical protein